jgi:hypothetical protein
MRLSSLPIIVVLTALAACVGPGDVDSQGQLLAAAEEEALAIWPDPENPPPLVCVGSEVPAEAFESVPGPLKPEPVEGQEPEAVVPAIGELAPAFQLSDFQAQSCGTTAVYGMEPFVGKVTVAALLAGW